MPVKLPELKYKGRGAGARLPRCRSSQELGDEADCGSCTAAHTSSWPAQQMHCFALQRPCLKGTRCAQLPGRAEPSLQHRARRMYVQGILDRPSTAATAMPDAEVIKAAEGRVQRANV